MRRAFRWIMTVLVLFFALYGFGTWYSQRRSQAHSRSSEGMFAKVTRIGVVEVSGVIMDSKKWVEQVDRFVEDPLIRGILVRINSPGGSVAPSQELYETLRRADRQKPVYAVMASVAASGGYYTALGARKIYGQPGTITGSIGVIMQFVDLSKLYEWAKFKPYSLKTGKFKDVGSPERPMSADEKDLMQGMIDSVLEQFRRAVVESRKLSHDKVVELSDGRIFSGEQAKKEHLIDEMGGLYEASQAMVSELKSGDKPKLIYPARKYNWVQEVLSYSDDDEASADSSVSRLLRVLELLTQAGQPASTALGREPALSGPLYLWHQ